jgi:hypothetical protein
MGKKSESRNGMNNPDHIFRELRNRFFGAKILYFFDADQRYGMEKIRIRINIPDPQHWS